MNIVMPIELYTDGSCSKNPGAGGFGYIIRYWSIKGEGSLPEPNTIECNKGFRLTTNNRMEIMAMLYGIKDIIEKLNNQTFELKDSREIHVFSDSEYLCNAINQGWIDKWSQNQWMTSGFKGSAPKPVKNKDLWEEILILKTELKNRGLILTITHIKGHNGHEFNEAADKLATQATSNGINHEVDEVYEKSRMM